MAKVPAYAVLLYMSDNNDLCRGARARLAQQLKSVEPCDQLRVGIEYSHLREPDFWNHKDITHRRCQIDDGKLVTVADLPAADMADPDTLHAALKWGLRRFPAEHHIVIMQGHGAAWKPFLPDEAFGAETIALDDRPAREPNRLTVPLAANVLESTARDVGIQPAILAHDSCLMGNLESAFQFRRGAGILLASEDLTHSTKSEYALDFSVPLGTILSRLAHRLNAGDNVQPEDVAHEWVQACGESWTTPTQSAWDLSKMKSIGPAVNALCDRLLDPAIPASALRDAFSKVRNFSSRPKPDKWDREYDYKMHLKDLLHLLDVVQREPALAAAKQAAAQLQREVKGMRLEHEAQPRVHEVGRTLYDVQFDRWRDYDAKHTGGMSIYVPDNEEIIKFSKKNGADYEALDFVKQTRWNKVIHKVVAG
jgi:hypothetical protein